MAKQWPMPSASDLEASQALESSAPYPEFHTYIESRDDVTSTPDKKSAAGTRSLSRLFARSPAAINEKRETLLADAERSAAERRSEDLESQASTDASTLLEDETSQPQQQQTRGPRLVSARFVADAIVGLTDGLTVPFALTAGLSVLDSTKIVVYAGLAELCAGAISMGLGGYLGAKSEEQAYRQTLSETEIRTHTSSPDVATSIQEVFAPYDLPSTLSDDLAFHLAKSPKLVQFLMHFQHNSPESEASRAITCAMTIALGYFVGGFLPLLPYFFVRQNVMLALWWSIGVMAVSLFGFGYGKTCIVCGWNGSRNVRQGLVGGLQMLLVGGVAAGTAMGLVRSFNSLAS